MIRFEVDRGATRSVSVLLIFAGATGTVTSLLLLALHTGALLTTLGAIGLLVSVIWILRARRLARTGRETTSHYLEIGTGGLTLAEGKEPRRVPWRDVQEIEVDEDRLVVRVRLVDTSSFNIEPRYRGISLGDLADKLREAHRTRPLLE